LENSLPRARDLSEFTRTLAFASRLRSDCSRQSTDADFHLESTIYATAAIVNKSYIIFLPYIAIYVILSPE
jgi:hypothetical protein